MKKTLSCLVSILIFFNILISPVVAENAMTDEFATNDETNIYPLLKSEADSWLQTIGWLQTDILNEINIFDHLPAVKYVSIEMNDEKHLNSETKIKINFDIERLLKDLLTNEIDAFIKDEDDKSIIEKFVKYGVNILTDSESIRFQTLLEDITSPFIDAIKNYTKASISHTISLKKIRKAEKIFQQISNNNLDTEEAYQQAAIASQNAIYACVLSAEILDENHKKSLDNEELVNKYIVDSFVGIVVDLSGYKSTYKVLELSASIAAKAIELETNSQLMYLNELLGSELANNWCPETESDKINYLNAISNQYADFGYKIADNYTLKITSYNAYGKDFSALKVVDIPEEICGMPVTKIGSRIATGDCVEEVIIPKTVASFDGSVFYKCTNLKTVYYNAVDANIETIHTGHIFEGCSNIEQIFFGSDIKTIPDSFIDTCAIKSLTIPASVTKIGEFAFSNCGCLLEVTIPKDVKMFEGSVFYKCTNLKTVYYNAVDANIETIHTGHIFEGCSNIEQIFFGSDIKTIPDSFIDTCAIKSLTIPASVTKIGEFAFSNCGCLTDVYYTSSQADREKIYIGSNNESLLNASWHYSCIHPKDCYGANVGHSVMDTANGNGLAFRFELTAYNVVKDDNHVADLTNATIPYLGRDCKLVGMGAILTNVADIGESNFTLEDVDNDYTVDVPAMYLQEAESDYCAFAARIVNIPSHALESTIYARPYYIVEVDGEEITVYGDVDSASCVEYM